MNKLIYPPEKAATSLDEKASKLSKSSNENVHVVVIYVSLRKINADSQETNFLTDCRGATN